MALVGASPAMAEETAICKSNEGGELACAEENQWEKVHAVATNPVILSSEGNISCTGSLFEVTLLALEAPQVGHNNSLLWSGCKTLFGIPCSVITSTLGTSTYLKTAANLGEMQFHGMTLTIKCGLGFECVYEGLPVFHLLGSTAFGDSAGNGGIRGVESEMTSGPLDAPCPPGIVLDVFWEALAAVYIKS